MGEKERNKEDSRYRMKRKWPGEKIKEGEREKRRNGKC